MNQFAARRLSFQGALIVSVAVILTAIAFCAAQSTATAARSLPQLLMILDSSSSMEDLIAGKLKYKLVRRAMSRALPAYQGRLQTGLIVFGRNHKNSCKDVARVVPLKTLRPKALSLVINNIKPKGKSPIGAALVDAVNMTIDSTNPLHILLIADGNDNCRNDICATARLVANHSPRTKVHVIGIGKTGPAKQLACISRATKGIFKQVATENELTTALSRILKTVTGKKIPVAKSTTTESEQRVASLATPPVAAPPLPVRRPPHTVAKYKRPLSRPATDIFEQKAAPIPETTITPPTRVIEETVPETAPETTQAVTKPTASRKIVQEPAEPMAKTVTAPAPTKVIEPEKPVRIAQNTAPAIETIPLPPQPLPVMPQQKPQVTKPTMRKVPAATFLGNKPSIEITLPQTSASVKLGALITEQGKQIQNGLVWRIYNTKKNDGGRYKLVKTLRAPRFEGTLPLGVYLVNLSWGRSHLTEKMDILSSKPFVRNFILNAGGLRLGARHIDGSSLPRRQVAYQIYSDERDQFGKRRLILDNARPDKTIRLNAGIYHIKSLFGSANGIIDTDITVEAGKLTDVVINHTASKVTFKLVNQPGGEALAGAIWRITSPDGKLIKEAGGALPTLILAAGDYTINAWYSSRTFARKVTIEPGAPVHVEIVIQ